MKIKFFLPTKEEWYGTYDGGYVEVYLTNDLYPTCGKWIRQIRIIFSGNDDCMWTKTYDIKEENKDIEFLDALDQISKMPLPITKKHLSSVGFECE